MIGKRRLIKPTFGVVIGTGLAMSVPAGQIVEIMATPAEGSRTVDVVWDGKEVMMFVSDLGDRSQEISA